MSKLINGKMLEEILLRDSVDLSIAGTAGDDILYVDVQNGTGRIGIKNATPAVELDVTGSAAISVSADVADLLLSGTTLAATATDTDLFLTANGTGEINASATVITNVGAPGADTTAAVNLQTMNDAIGGAVGTGVTNYVLTTTSSTTAATEAFTDGTGGTGRLVLPDSSTWRFEINVVARQDTATTITATNFVTGTRYIILTTGTTDFTLIGAANSTPGTVFNATGPGLGDGTASVGEIGDSGGYQFTGVIARQTGVANTAIVGVVAEVIDAEDNALWAVSVDEDTTNGSLRVQVTGEATDIKWVVFVRVVEVI